MVQQIEQFKTFKFKFFKWMLCTLNIHNELNCAQLVINNSNQMFQWWMSAAYSSLVFKQLFRMSISCSNTRSNLLLNDTTALISMNSCGKSFYSITSTKCLRLAMLVSFGVYLWFNSSIAPHIIMSYYDGIGISIWCIFCYFYITLSV